MIVVYQDWNKYRRFFAHAGNSTGTNAASGFLKKPIAGSRLVIDLVIGMIAAPASADTDITYNVQLVTVNAAGTVSPASPNQVAIYDLFKDSPVSATQHSSRTFARSGLRIEIPEGFGIGWQAVNADINMETVGAITYTTAPTFDLLVTGWVIPVSSRETTGIPDDSFLQPAGAGV